ncbi:hypothetical protein ACJRO7_022172 [Eucalyptus globulus]|uniref:TIR domain-containing protein n=1 Tax=Eucalyptus globulus TaxID=34317 RepID=A0ABD3KUM4_EUCGL
MSISHVSNPSSSTSPRLDYQVFLSFRGPDTRRNFADFLYTSLTYVGIRVFKDDKELEVGKEINPQLIQAIELSKISIPIISKEYAFSKSCLIELDQMVKCMDNKNPIIIIPVFYYVEPKDVSNCTGPIEMALNEHKKRGRDDSFLNPWKSALQRIGDLAGYHLHENQEKTHGEFIKLIVHKVEQMLRTRDLILPKKLVGVNPHVQEIMAKLKVDCHSEAAVKIVDPCEKVLIHGIPGVGKTVLAKCLYNKLNHLFDACSFLEKFPGEVRDPDILSVLNRLISDVHKGLVKNFSCYDHALTHIQNGFRTTKVLLLLDDVKDHEQLSAIVGELDWLGPGSRVIVTSQKDDVLKKVEGAEKFCLRTMQQDEALKLFCWHAFGRDSSPEEFRELATNIVAATDGLPLALEKAVWMEKLIQLKEAPDKSVQKSFLESYATLDENEQNIFLDIACFFNGIDKRIPHYMWNHCKYFPCKSILSLRARSWVEIGENKELCMRGILKAFGREIVKSENKNEPCQRSRLWNHEEAQHVLNEGKGTKKVEALGLKFADRSEGNIISFQCDKFDGLQNLRFLELDRADIKGEFRNHFLRLRWLGWQGTPWMFDIKSLKLNLQKLAILDLSGSRVPQDWKGWKLLSTASELKVLKLTGCAHLSSTPEFPSSLGLERLILEGCSGLAVIDSSIRNLQELVSLNMKGCSLLCKLPDLGPMGSLKELVIDGTSISRINVQEGGSYPEKIGRDTLSLKNCRRLTNLPDGIGWLRSLQLLDLSNTLIRKLPTSVKDLEATEVLGVWRARKGKRNFLFYPDVYGVAVDPF